jgi:NAD(P)-dependent dehydrogenase (short-subunit alcohol dehydrogenase family)
MSKIILVSDASNGFGRLTAEALALSGHIVYAAMKETKARRAVEARKMAAFSQKHDVNLRAIELDVLSQGSVDKAVARIVAATGRIDVLIHSAAYSMDGGDGVLSPRQLAALYDVNVLGTQRVNRAVLPQMRLQQQGLVIWVSNSGPADGMATGPMPGFATRTGMDATARLRANELGLWGIETSIIVPDAAARGIHRFVDPDRSMRKSVAADDETGPYAGFGEQMKNAFSTTLSPRTDKLAVADAIVDVVDTPSGWRPFQVHIDPVENGIDADFTAFDRLRGDMLHSAKPDRPKPRLLS